MSKLTTLTIVAFLVSFNIAGACLNDRSLPERESEFRSQYQSPYTTQVETPANQTFSEGPVLPAIGLAMLAGSISLAWLGTRENG